MEEECVNYPSGIQTIIGNKGYIIKDEDKSKICLARTLYQNAEIFLFDEPFQALPEYERKSVHKGIKKFLKFKTVIIATQNQQILDKIDSVIIMSKGRIVHYGLKDETADKLLDGIYRNVLVEDHSIKDDSIFLYEEGVSEDMNPLNLLAEYSKRGGPVRLFFIILIALISYVGLNLGIDYLLVKYFNENLTRKHLQLIGVMTAIMWFLNLISLLLINIFIPKASHELYTQSVANILEAPVKFFKSQNIETIHSKFLKDTIVVDNEIYDIGYQIITCGAYGFGSLLIMFVAMPLSLIPFVFILIWFILVVRIPLPSLTDFESLEVNNLSRLFSYLQDIFSGIENLRIDKMNKVLIEKLYISLNDLSAAKYFSLNAGHWLLIRLQIIFTTLFIISVLITIIKVENNNFILIGIYFVHNSVNLDYLTDFCRACSELRKKTLSIKRLLELTHLEIEEKYTYRPAYSLKTGGQLPHIALQQVMLR